MVEKEDQYVETGEYTERHEVQQIRIERNVPKSPFLGC